MGKIKSNSKSKIKLSIVSDKIPDEESFKSPHGRRKSLVSILPFPPNSEGSKKTRKTPVIEPNKLQNESTLKVIKRTTKKKSGEIAKRKKIISALTKSGDFHIENVLSSEAKQNNFSSTLLEKFNIKIEDISSAVNGIVEFHSKNPKVKNQLFSEHFPLFLQVNCHRIPSGHPKLMRIPLKHSILSSDDEICLIVSEVKGIGNKEHEKHVEHYENLLSNKGVKNIKKIMTMHELKTEYETFEQKSRLVDLYNMFLVCGKISGKVVKKCGKIFYKKRKIPNPVKLQSSKLKEHIEKVLSKVFFHVHLKGDSYTLQFGHNHMDTKQLVENVCSAVEFLKNEFPGGFDNIKGLSVFAPRTPSIPIYLSTEPPVDKKIKMKILKTPTFKTHKGELTTLPNARVTVRPTGEVIVKKISSDIGTSEKITDEDIILANKEDSDTGEKNKNSKKSKQGDGEKKKNSKKSKQGDGEKNKNNKKSKQDTVSTRVGEKKKKANQNKSQTGLPKKKKNETIKRSGIEKRKDVISSKKDKLKKIKKLQKKSQKQ